MRIPEHQRREPVKPAGSALYSVNEYVLRRSALHAMNCAHPLRRDACVLHCTHHLQRPWRRVDHREPAAVFDEPRGRCGYVRRGFVSLVPDDAQLVRSAEQRAARLEVRRIAHRQRKSAASQLAVRLAHIGAKYPEFILNPVQRGAARGHIRDLGLYLYACNRNLRTVRQHYKRYRTRSAAHIHTVFSPAWRGEIRQQHRIRAETEGLGALDYTEPVVLQVIYPFARIYINVSFRHKPMSHT